jgi:sarcosine oxidase subunit beta
MSERYDVIIVGGGMLGLSTAFHLARQRAPSTLRVLLLQAGDLGGGTSAACSGRAQVAEGHLDPLNLRLIREGLARLETLEQELDAAFEWRRAGFLALIPALSAAEGSAPPLWDDWAARASALTAAGIPTELLDRRDLQEAEPHLNTEGFMGAAYAVEGLLNPFLFCWAYAQAARRHGALLLPQTPVTDLRVTHRRVTAVQAGGAWFEAGQVVLMCGAWTSHVARLAGAEVPLSHTHAEAFITEPVSLPLHNTIELADFYERIHGREQAVAVGFSPDPRGALIVTEAVTQTRELHRRSSAWGLSGIAAELLQLYPALAGVRALRTWAIPTAFTPDDEPVVGWLPEFDNLFVAAAFLETITVVPVVSEWLAGMILGEAPPADLSRYAPDRFSRPDRSQLGERP